MTKNGHRRTRIPCGGGSLLPRGSRASPRRDRPRRRRKGTSLLHYGARYRILARLRELLELPDAHRGHREERDPDERDRYERDRMRDDRDSGRRIPRDAVHVGQRELDRHVVRAKTSGGRKHETEHGGRSHDEARRKGKLEMKRPKDRVDLYVDDEPHGERPGGHEEEEPRALERGEAVHERFGERARPGLKLFRQPAPEPLEKSFGRAATKHGKKDRRHEHEKKQGGNDELSDAARARETGRGRDQEEEHHRGAVEDPLEQHRGEQRREGKSPRPREEGRPENLSDLARQVVRGEAEGGGDERGIEGNSRDRPEEPGPADRPEKERRDPHHETREQPGWRGRRDLAPDLREMQPAEEKRQQERGDDHGDADLHGPRVERPFQGLRSRTRGVAGAGGIFLMPILPSALLLASKRSPRRKK